jgi:hypothetical protein
MKEKQVAERGNVPGELGHQRRHNNWREMWCLPIQRAKIWKMADTSCILWERRCLMFWVAGLHLMGFLQWHIHPVFHVFKVYTLWLWTCSLGTYPRMINQLYGVICILFIIPKYEKQLKCLSMWDQVN